MTQKSINAYIHLQVPLYPGQAVVDASPSEIKRGFIVCFIKYANHAYLMIQISFT